MHSSLAFILRVPSLFLLFVFLGLVHADAQVNVTNPPDFSKAIAILNQDNNYTGYTLVIGDAEGTMLNYERGPPPAPTSDPIPVRLNSDFQDENCSELMQDETFIFCIHKFRICARSDRFLTLRKIGSIPHLKQPILIRNSKENF